MPTGKIVIAATAVTVSVGKKTAIAGGKGSFIHTCADFPSAIHILKFASLIACVKHLVFPYSWLILSSFHLPLCLKSGCSGLNLLVELLLNGN